MTDKPFGFGLRLAVLLGLTIFLGLSAITVPSAPHPQAAETKSSATSHPVVGQAMTLLPDGRWLVTGGEGPDGATNSAEVRDPRTGSATALPDGLNHARIGHTATLLPDGTVLIFGGTDGQGEVVTLAELFDPVTQSFTPLGLAGVAARAYHTATLLTTGEVLFAGGISPNGEVLGKLEAWDFRTRASVQLPIELLAGRKNHSATLLPDGSVIFWGGIDRNGLTLNYGEIFDPRTQGIRLETSPPHPPGQPPRLEASFPDDGAEDVTVDVILALRFSKPLQVETVNTSTVVLTDLDETIAAKVIPAEGGMLAFVTPKASLKPGTTYTLTLAGPTDQFRASLRETVVTFQTVGEAESGAGGIAAGHPGPGTDPFNSPWRKLPPLEAKPGVTALAGQVLTLDGRPLPRVTLEIDGNSARTDGTGRFLLEQLTAGHHEMWIDGGTTNTPHATYGLFEVGVDIIPGQTNVLAYTIWMPEIDTAHTVTIPAPTQTETVVSTPLIPGLELRIPPQTTIWDRNHQLVTKVSITRIPVNQPPFPLPAGVEVPLYFTIQPGGAYLKNPTHTGAQLIYPNYTHLRPGERVNFWNYDAEEKGWYIYGQGTVSPDAQRVVPDPGVTIYEFTGAMINSLGRTPPGYGPKQGNEGATDGEPVDLGTGLFVYRKTDLFLNDVIPVALTRTYRPADDASRPFGIGTTFPYAIFLWSAQQYQQADLVLPDGGRVHYIRVSPGLAFEDAIFESTDTPTIFYGSRFSYNMAGLGWDLKLKNGTIYRFGDVSPLQYIQDRYGNRITLTWSDRTGPGNTSGTGNILQVTSPNGRWIKFTYDSSNRITQAQDILGRTVTYTYNTAGQLSTVTDPKGGVTTYTYDANNNMTTIRDARQIVYLTNEYDANHRVIRQTQADNSTFQFDYVVDATGKITQTTVTDPRGKIRRVTFNSSGYMATDTRGVGTPEEQTITYTRQGGSNLVTSVTDSLNRQTSFTYDAVGNVTSVTGLAGTPNAVTSFFSYEPTFSKIASVTDPLGHTSSFSYDNKGNLIAASDPLGNQARLAYNSAGQPVSVIDPLGNTVQFSYDLGDLIAVTDPLGRTVNRFLDSAGRLISVSNPLGDTTRYEYDALNQLTEVTDAAGGVTSFEYDPNGNLLSVTDARNNATSYIYDNMDRLETRTEPLLHTESYVYDENSNLTQFTDRRGRVAKFTYDSLNRRTFVGFGWNGSTYESTITYSYDAGSRLTQVVDSLAGTITPSYDSLNRLLSETTPQGTVSYTYDSVGRRSTMSVPGQQQASYSYDNADRLTQITQGTSTVSFGYDAADRRTTLTLPNGVTITYGYDAASQLTGMAYSAGQATLGDLSYAYDQAGRRMQVGGSFARTGLPQPLSTANYNANNQLTQWGTATLSYDLNGNMTSDGTNTYTWDARNQLTSMNGGASASFQYDAFGRRLTRTVGGASRSFVYDGVNIVQEQLGGSQAANLLTGGMDEYFVRTDPAWSQHYLPDALGSSVALADSSGAVLTQYTYEPFGQTTVAGAAAPQSFQYTGRENDGTGLYYYRARYYSPNLGRFISEDPARFLAGDFNLYSYIGNSPMNGTDPSGLWSPGAHDELIRHALAPCSVSDEEIGLIQEGSRFIDEATTLDPKFAYIHSMKAPWQTNDEAINARNEYIERTMIEARNHWDMGYGRVSLGLLGQALHPLTDLKSPAHTDEDGNPITWCGWHGCWGDLGNLAKHSPNDTIGKERLRDLRRMGGKIFPLTDQAIRDSYAGVTGRRLSCKKQ